MPRSLPYKKKTKVKKPKYDIDKVVYIFAFGAPLFELPQLYTIYSQQNAGSVSPFTWGFFAVASFAWLLYAVHHRLRPLIVSYVLFFSIESVIFAGILLYR